MLPVNGGQDKEGEGGRMRQRDKSPGRASITNYQLPSDCLHLLPLGLNSSENCDHIDDIEGQASYCVVIHVLFKGQGFVKVIRDSVGLK